MPGRVFALALLAAAACGSKSSAEPAVELYAGPPAAACDAPQAHECFEIYDAALLPSLQGRWAVSMRDKPLTCTLHAHCPAAGRKDGCQYPPGTIEYWYGDRTGSWCIGGKPFAATEKPHADPPRTWHCVEPDLELCDEYVGVFDMTGTAHDVVCKAHHGTWGTGSCPTSLNGVPLLPGHCLQADDGDTISHLKYLAKDNKEGAASVASSCSGDLYRGIWIAK